MNTKNILLIITALIIVAYLVYTFLSGKQEVTEKDLDPARFEELVNKPENIILDVRSAFEFKGDKIKGAQNISISNPDFNTRIANLDKDKTYLVYCAHGNRSTSAVKIMKEKGFKNVYNLLGGIDSWKSANKPVVK